MRDAGTGLAAVAAIPAVQRILQDRIPAVPGCVVAAVGANPPRSSRPRPSATPAPGTTAAASASSALRSNTLLPPLQPWFAKDTAFFSAKAQKLKNSAKQNSWIVCRFLVLRLKTPVLGTAMSRSSRILQSRILG